MPYDRFLREQIAGDELADYWTAYKTRETLPPEVVEALVATGYLRCAADTSRPDFVNIKNAPGYYYQTLEDTVTIVASSTLGLTRPVCQVPHAQVRPDHAGRLLSGPGGLHERVSPRAVDPPGRAEAARGDRGAGGAGEGAQRPARRGDRPAPGGHRRDPVELRRPPVRRASGRAPRGDPRGRPGRLRHRRRASGTRSSATSSTSSRPSCGRRPRRSRACSPRSLPANAT